MIVDPRKPETVEAFMKALEKAITTGEKMLSEKKRKEIEINTCNRNRNTISSITLKGILQ